MMYLMEIRNFAALLVKKNIRFSYYSKKYLFLFYVDGTADFS